MRLEIRDAEDQTVYDIGPEGAVLGRERAKTDISLRDESISKRHARIFQDDGGWFLEDLGSSNGTYVDEQRISGAVSIGSGMSFSLAQRRFEVVYMDAAAGGMDEDPAPLGMGPPGGGDMVDDMPPLPGMESQAYVSAENTGAPMGFDSSDDGDEAENKGVKYFLVAVPKAIAYYMLKVPLMGLNPIGVIRKGVNQQPLDPMSKMEVAAYAIPAGVFGALVGGVFAAIAMLVNGNVGAAIGALVASLPSAAIAGAIGGVFGFFMHPILNFLINLLKGESNAKSRTNYVIMAYTFGILTAVPNGIGTVVSALPIPFISLLGPLLTVLVSLVGIYMAYLWVQAFDLHKFVRYLVLVLGVLAVLGAASGFVTGLISQISSFGDSSGDTSGMVADNPDLTDEQREAIEAAGDNPEAAAAIAAAQAQAQAAMAAAGEAGGEVDDRTKAALEAMGKKSAEVAALAAKQAAEARARGAKVVDDPVDDDPVEVIPARKDPVRRDPVRKDPVRKDPVRRDPVRTAARAPAPKMAAGAVNTDEHPLGRTAFVGFLEKRNAIEKAIDDNPGLLRRRDVKSGYEKIWSVTYDIREKYRKRYKRKDRWERDKIGSRLKGQEIFDRTHKEVDRLYSTIFAR